MADRVKNHHVLLYVDTENIIKKKEDDYCWLGSPYDNDKSNYIVTVDKGDTITWIGVSISSPNDIVSISSIIHESGSNVFGRRKLNHDCCHPDRVIGTARNRNSEPEGYSINFEICNGDNGGAQNIQFMLDPEIRVRP